MRMYCNWRRRRRQHAHLHHNNNDLRKDLVIVKIIQSLFAQFGSTQSYTHTHMQRNVKSTQWNSGTVHTVFAHWTLPSSIQYGHWCYFVLLHFSLTFFFACASKNRINGFSSWDLGKFHDFLLGNEWETTKTFILILFSWDFCYDE